MLNEKLLILGRIHWYLVAASDMVDGQRSNLDIENDEINWWIYKRESDIASLKKRTESALVAAQHLKEASEKIARFSRMTLALLENKYEKFSFDQEENLLAIFDYIQWLYRRDPLAPTVLFCYRTWGATRLADRSICIKANDINDIDEINRFTLVVLGITKRGSLLKDSVRRDIEADLYENIDEEYYENGGVIKASESDVDVHTAFEASVEFAEYFEQLRESLRNILLDIEKKETEERLITSDSFWQNFIVKATGSRKTEQLYWDFKETLEIWKPIPIPQKKDQEHKFAERIAGFANAEGGVIIVGVTDSPPRQIVGIGPDSRTVENNMKNTMKVINDYINYKSDFVRINQVSVQDKNGVQKTCVVIVIDQTYLSVGVKGLDGKSFSYPVRKENGLTWEDPGILAINKIIIKSDNHHFLSILRQFVYESA